MYWYPNICMPRRAKMKMKSMSMPAREDMLGMALQ